MSKARSTRKSSTKAVRTTGRPPRSLWRAVIARDGGKCIYCGARGALTVDHVVARVEGGPHKASNLVAACNDCNSLRGACPLDLWVIWCERRGCGPAATTAARVAVALATPLAVVKRKGSR